MQFKTAEPNEISAKASKPYLRRVEVAELLGISLNTVGNWVKQGILPVIRPSAGVVLFRLCDIEQALNRFRVSAVGENQ